MQGGYLDIDNPAKDGSSTQKFKERGGLIPINAKILNDSIVNSEEGIEYLGNLLSDVSVVGYIKDYQEMEARIKVKLWDQTGVMEIIFYNKNESESHSGLSNFYYEGNNKLVKIFGTIKSYKREKQLQGAKIMNVDDNEIIYHSLEIANDWLYLTGKLNQIKQESGESYTEDARNIARGYGGPTSHYSGNLTNHPIGYSRNDNPPSMNNVLAQVDSSFLNVLREISRNSGGRVHKNELHNILEKRFSRDKIVMSLRYLCENGYLLEEDDFFTTFQI